MIQPKKIVVIGAGICGLSAAIWLRRSGHEVLLLDKDHPGAGASYGNAGLLAQWAILPVNTPDLVPTAIKYLSDPKSPLFMKWGYLPKMLPWLARFISNANERDNKRMIDGLIPILNDSVDQHRALTRGTVAEKWITSSDFSYVYTDRAAFEKDRHFWNIRRDFGLVPETVEGPAVREVEPILGPDFQCLAMLKDHGHVLDPGAYMADLAEVLTQEGGTYHRAEVQDITLSDGKVTSVETDAGSFACDLAVMAAGIWSKPIMKKLGMRVHLEAERGYHLHFSNPSQMPRNPMMMAKAKFAVNPMASGLRCAGTVELGGIDYGPSRAPITLLRDTTKKAFPSLTYDGVEEWMGFRPSTPDSLPLIGEFGNSGIHATFGHQHIGLTAGPKSGRLLADMINGRRPNIDMSPYSANRFGKTRPLP